MRETTKHNLIQWDLDDQIRMADFNNNNVKIENALENVKSELLDSDTSLSQSIQSVLTALNSYKAEVATMLNDLRNERIFVALKSITVTNTTTPSIALNLEDVDLSEFSSLKLIIQHQGPRLKLGINDDLTSKYSNATISSSTQNSSSAFNLGIDTSGSLYGTELTILPFSETAVVFSAHTPAFVGAATYSAVAGMYNACKFANIRKINIRGKDDNTMIANNSSFMLYGIKKF
ncbi:hypothetical protein LJC01_03215 [Clostridiaceae bacterium OttesenSCG-928-D20]|nr:hypothetical protein [Clostridiaceae bacterium OttesenSCG-928-D20]